MQVLAYDPRGPTRDRRALVRAQDRPWVQPEQLPAYAEDLADYGGATQLITITDRLDEVTRQRAPRPPLTVYLDDRVAVANLIARPEGLPPRGGLARQLQHSEMSHYSLGPASRENRAYRGRSHSPYRRRIADERFGESRRRRRFPTARGVSGSQRHPHAHCWTVLDLKRP